MNDALLAFIAAVLGIVVGFFGNYLIAKFNARHEMKKSISESRALFYLKLWRLCNPDVDSFKKQQKRLEKLQKWYQDGGGLLLSFKASERFGEAIKLLKLAESHRLRDQQCAQLRHELSWLRTEMKFEVGSYTRRDANRQLPDIRQHSDEVNTGE